MNIFIDFANFLIDKLFILLNAIIQFLPDSPFSTVTIDFLTPYLGYINWIFPIGKMVAFLTLWTTGVLLYYAYTIILRVTQAID